MENMQTCIHYLAYCDPFPISHSSPFPFLLFLEGFFKVIQVAGVINKDINIIKINVYFFVFGRDIRSTLKVFFNKVSKTTEYTLSGPKLHFLKAVKLFEFK